MNKNVWVMRVDWKDMPLEHSLRAGVHIENMRRLRAVQEEYASICLLPDELERVQRMQELFASTVPVGVLAELTRESADTEYLRTSSPHPVYTRCQIQHLMQYYLRKTHVHISRCMLILCKAEFDTWWEPDILHVTSMYLLPEYLPGKQSVWEPYWVAMQLADPYWENNKYSPPTGDCVQYPGLYLSIDNSNLGKLTGDIARM